MRSFVSRYGTMLIEETEYADGNLAVQLYQEDGEPFATLSVNVPDYAPMLRPGQFFAKTYSENAGVAADALSSGAFQDTGVRVATGFGPMPVWSCR